MDAASHPLTHAAAGPALACEDHRAVVLLPYRLAAGADGDLRAAADSLHRALTAPPGHWQAVDRATARNALHQDLLPVIDQILHGGPEPADSALYHGHPPLRLDLRGLPDAYRLAFRDAATQRLAQAGVTAGAALVHVKGATLYTFPTGLVIVALVLSFSEPFAKAASVPAPFALEALYALGHAADRGNELRPVELDRRVLAEALAPGDRVVLDKDARFAARRWRSDDGEPASGPARPRALVALEPPGASPAEPRALVFGAGEPASLVDVVGAWLAPAGGILTRPVQTASHGRLFTFFVGLYERALPSEVLTEVAYRMSRRYGADYSLTPGAAAAAVLRPFDNVCHAVSTQGAAVAVRNTGAAFIERFVDSAITPAYLPMAVVSYHEYMHLLHLTQGIARLPDEREPKADKDRLQKLRAALVAFRLYFRFSHISDLSHHNQVHELWRRSLDLDRMLQDLTLDVREGEQVLERLHREDEEARHAVQVEREAAERSRVHAQAQEHERRAKYWKKWGTIGLAIGEIYLLLHIFEALVELRYPRKWMAEWLAQAGGPGGPLAPETMARMLETYHTAHLVELIVSAIAVALGIALGIIAFKGGSSGGGH